MSSSFAAPRRAVNSLRRGAIGEPRALGGGIQAVALETGVPCAFGVITCDTMDQALARAGGDKRDQGEHAAQAVLALAELRGRLG